MKVAEGTIRLGEIELNAELFDASLFYFFDESSIQQNVLLSDYKRIIISFETFKEIWDSNVYISGANRAFLGKEKFNCLIFTYNFVERYVLIFDWEWEPLESKFKTEDRKKKLKNILDENT
jgi:hypothetical protein